MSAIRWCWHQFVTMSAHQGLALGLTLIVLAILIQQYVLLVLDKPDTNDPKVTDEIRVLRAYRKWRDGQDPEMFDMRRIPEQREAGDRS